MSTKTRITVADYERMIAAGDFERGTNGQRVELIDGELREMSPIYPPHANAVSILEEWSFENRPKDKIRVRTQNPIVILDGDSVPEPDLVWAARRDYTSGHPEAPDVLLLIEVSDSSVAYDCGEKAEVYARAGFADYWVVNIPALCVEVFRQPEDGEYRSQVAFKTGDEIHLLAFPKIKLPVALLFPTS
jgi:Uma2 family endonuclease